VSDTGTIYGLSRASCGAAVFSNRAGWKQHDLIAIIQKKRPSIHARFKLEKFWCATRANTAKSRRALR
jgi:hypothetical protein